MAKSHRRLSRPHPLASLLQQVFLDSFAISRQLFVTIFQRSIVRTAPFGLA